LQWLYADAADVPQTGDEVWRNSDPMRPKFTRPRNSASGSLFLNFEHQVHWPHRVEERELGKVSG
jgi:hypothetical protein